MTKQPSATTRKPWVPTPKCPVYPLLHTRPHATFSQMCCEHLQAYDDHPPVTSPSGGGKRKPNAYAALALAKGHADDAPVATHTSPRAALPTLTPRAAAAEREKVRGSHCFARTMRGAFVQVGRGPRGLCARGGREKVGLRSWAMIPIPELAPSAAVPTSLHAFAIPIAGPVCVWKSPLLLVCSVNRSRP